MPIGTFTVFVITTICLVESADGQINKNRECLLQFKSSLKVNVSCVYGIKDCSYAKLESKFPHLFNKTVWRAPAPAMLSSEELCTDDSESLGAGAMTNQPAVHLVWKLPEDSGAQLIRGFDIRVDGHVRGYKCFIVDLLETVTAPGLTFNGTILLENHNREYVVTVQSLPGNDASGALEKHIYAPKCFSELSPSGSWSVRDVNITYEAENSRLHLRFKSPPKRFEFEDFKVSIRSEDYSTFREFEINKTQHTFTDIKPGKYEIYLEPYDPFPWQADRCKCRNARDRCSQCTLSEIHYMARSKSKDPPDIAFPREMYIIAGVAVGITVLALASIAVICKELKRRRTSCFSSNVKVSSLNTTDSETDVQSNILVFINVEKEVEDRNGNKKSYIKGFLKENKDNIERDADVFIYDKEYNIDTFAKEDMQKIHSQLSYYLQREMANAAKHSKKSCNELCINENCRECLLPKEMNIICCFLVSENLSKEIIERIKQLEDNVVRANYVNVMKTVLIMNPNSPNLDFNNEIVSYRIPEEYNSFVKHLKTRTVSCHRSYSSNRHCKIDSTQKTNIEITVDSDTNSLDNKESSAESICQITSRAELCTRLDVPRPVRERYVSNDSGQGDSVDSYRCSQIEDNSEWCIDFDDRYNDLMTDISNGALLNQNIQTHYKDCSSTNPYVCPDNVHFFPPEPSEISESDIVENYRDNFPNVSAKGATEHSFRKFCSVSKGQRHVKSFNNNLIYNSNYGQNASMDSIMTKMAALNARSMYIIENEAIPGETYSLCDGNA